MPYDEIHDETGARRAPYAAIQARTGIDVTRPDPAVASTLRRAGIHPVPLVLGEDEYRSTLVPGVLQRALVLQALFEDLAIGSARVIDSGLVRPDELAWILGSAGLSVRSLRQLWQGQSREQIRFVYGPDLVRSPDGEWLVLEDNVGCVGGMAEGRATRDAYLQAAGLAAGDGDSSRTDLARAIDSFLERAGVPPHTSGLFGFAGWTSPGGCGANDFETRRKADCLRSFGITVTQPEELLARIREGAVDLTAIVNLSATLTAAYQDLARVAFTQCRVPVLGAPCVELIATKSFLPFDGALAEAYLGEPLLLRSAPSRLVRERPDRLPDQGVVKRSTGCQGTEVFFLDEMRDAGRSRSLLAALDEWGPCAAILQEHVTRSVLGGTGNGSPETVQLEIRPLVYVYGWRAALVGEALAGRAVAASAERRGNISRGAAFLPVLREPLRGNGGGTGRSRRGPALASRVGDRRSD